MEIIGIGVDCIEIERFDLENKEFLNKIFSVEEIKYCEKKANPAESFAVRFAGKEAVIKAVNKIKKLLPENIEILNEEDGNPTVNILDSGFPKDIKILISLSHSRRVATAISVAQKL